MATEIKTEYLGDGRVKLEHGPTGESIVTDLPPDNGGKGRTFSPTDLFASALSSCVLTIMAKAAEKDAIDLSGASITITKEMNADPRRIRRLSGLVRFPEGLDAKARSKLMNCVRACPVTRSLHPEVEVDLQEA